MIQDLPLYLQKEASEIDSAIFSGDTFIDKDCRAAMKELVDRWQRGLNELEIVFPEEND